MISDDSSWLFSCLQTPMDISEIRWLSVWCTRFTVNFAEIFIPHDPKVPRRLFLERFPQLHQASLEKLRSDPIQILDDRSFLIPAFYLYTGGDKGYRFQASLRASPDKFNVDIPNENNRYDDLVDYNGRDIIIVLPTSTTMYDIAGLAVRDVVRERVLGWISVPSVGELESHPIPPSLGQNTQWWPDTSPPASSTHRPSHYYQEDTEAPRPGGGGYNTPPSTPPPKQYALPNCREFLGRRIRLQWSNEPDHVYFRLMAKTREDEYAALGECRVGGTCRGQHHFMLDEKLRC